MTRRPDDSAGQTCDSASSSMFHGLTTSLTARRLALRCPLDDDEFTTRDATQNTQATHQLRRRTDPDFMQPLYVLHCTCLEKTNPDQH